MTAQTSEHGGVVRGLLGEMDAGDDPIDTAITRDAVVNNALHLLDEDAQVIVCIVTGSASAGDPIEMASPSTTEFALMPAANWFYLPRIRHGDGSSYRVRVYMRASISAAGTATFRVALRMPGDLRPSFGAATTWWADVTTTNTTGEDLACTLYVSGARVAGITAASWESADGSSDPASAFAYTGFVQVWAKSSSGTSLPRIHAITAAEFAGTR